MNKLPIHYDTALLNKAFIGFDSLFKEFESKFENLNVTYPPYNVVKYDDNRYALEIAVTGFDPADVSVEIDNRTLVVNASQPETDDTGPQYVFRGLAGRNFTRKWALSEYMEVGEGKIKNGVLTIELTRVVPEALKPRTLKITAE